MKKPTVKRAYDKLRAIIEHRGGRMYYQRAGFRHGAWQISLGAKARAIESTGRRLVPELDRLYIPLPRVENPTTWDDYSNELVPDAESQLLALLEEPSFRPSTGPPSSSAAGTPRRSRSSAAS